jgi:putative membrane protein
VLPSTIGTLLAALVLGAAPAPRATLTTAALTDAQIAAIFDAANTFDMETAAIAEKRGSKAEREFGAQLVRDHRSVRAQGRALVKKLGVTATLPKDNALVETVAKGHGDAIKKLKAAKRGADFDRTFLQHEIDFHQAVIEAVKSTLLPAIQNAELKQLVTSVAPAFQAHLDMAKNLLAQVK